MTVRRAPYPADGIVHAMQGDTVDLICARYFGTTGVVTELVMDTNKGLAALGPVLPEGTRITLPSPDAVTPAKPKTINLWD